MSTVPATWDGAPTLSDTQVLEFCKQGYLLLEGVVPDEVNRRAFAYCEAHPELEPTAILEEEWFVQGVILHPRAAGAVRSLLGPQFHLPVLMSNHRLLCPAPATGGWHVDGNYQYTTELNYLQVFYYPQDTPLEMGPTQILPGSHLLHHKARFMAHLGAVRNTLPTAAPAGSIFITAYQIWHRRGPASAQGVRNLLKYFYWRTAPPHRDWVQEPDFDFATARYSSPAAFLAEQFRDDARVARLFLWLCGKADAYRNLGGQSWPLPARRNDLPYGLPESL